MVVELLKNSDRKVQISPKHLSKKRVKLSLFITNFLSIFSDDLTEKEIEIKLEISKKAGLLRKPIRFVDVPGRIDESIPPCEKLSAEYIDKNPVHRCIQVIFLCMGYKSQLASQSDLFYN